MIIFTNDESQHLLLNIDLIEIAFNCMENSTEITMEAQRNVARLTSKIVKFPKVQRKLLKQNGGSVAMGMADLINHICKSEE
jgi:hypothetical protein